jgi:hypothetical protein
VPEVTTIAEAYVGIWNEPDPERRRTTMRELWTPEAVHSAGPLVARGYAELEARISRSHQKNIMVGGYRFRPTSNHDTLRNAVKFGWEMTPAGSDVVESAGVVFAILDDDGRILYDYLFVES